MQKVTWRNLWERESWVSRIVILLAMLSGIVLTLWLKSWFFGIFLAFVIYVWIDKKHSTVKCPGREDEACGHLIGKQERYCRYCGRKNDLI